MWCLAFSVSGTCSAFSTVIPVGCFQKLPNIFKNWYKKLPLKVVVNFRNCVYISWKIQILTILRHKITQIFTKKYYLLSKFSKLHNLETHFCELLRPRAPPFQKIKWNPWNLVTTLRKSCFLGPTIFEIPQPNWY